MVIEVSKRPVSDSRLSTRSFAIALPAALLLVLGLAMTILHLGNNVLGTPVSTTGGSGSHQDLLDTASKFLLAVALVMGLTHLFGRLVRRIGQPPVVGEIIAGIALGPSLLATISPEVWGYLFPPAVLSGLNLASQLGLVAFMFLVGWEIDLDRLRRSSRAMLTVSTASLAVPFLAGLLLSVTLFQTYRTERVGFTPFALFVGLALAITALPVLARILDDNGLIRSNVGNLAIASAVIEDAAAWALLAVALAFANISSTIPAPMIVVLTIAFAAFMLLAVRPALAWVVRAAERRGAAELTLLPLALIGALTSGVITQVIGIHAIFGAFLFGVIMPRRTVVAELVATRIRSFTMAVLLPLFFAAIGMRTSIGSIGTKLSDWLLPAVIFVVAVVCKLVGAGLAARASGMSWADSYTVGVLMNCRGLTEMVIASIGLQFAIIDARLFTTLVLVALGTTALTTPLLWLRYRGRTHDVDQAAPANVATPALTTASPTSER